MLSFDGQLAEWSGHWTGRLVEALGLSDEHVVDVGGGTGALLGAVLTLTRGRGNAGRAAVDGRARQAALRQRQG